MEESSESRAPITETGAAVKAVSSLKSPYRVGFYSSLSSSYFSNNTAVKRAGWSPGGSLGGQQSLPLCYHMQVQSITATGRNTGVIWSQLGLIICGDYSEHV